AESWELRKQVIRDRRAIAGGSDCGAHVDMLDTFAMTTSLLGPCVRDRGMVSLEEAVHLLTGGPAGPYGLVDRRVLRPGARGVLRPGVWADLVVFDASEVGPGDIEMRHDMPAGASRLYSIPTGVEHVFVAGTRVVRDGGQLTGELPGQVLRSGRDTRTVRVAD